MSSAESNMTIRLPPIVCFVGRSNSGKTTLVAQVLQELCRRQLRVGALKHASHGFQMDQPGKDTYHFRQAGAVAVGIASPSECAIITSTDTPTTLMELAAAMPRELDLIVCEGFASHDAPKIGVHRAEYPLPDGLQNLRAVVGSKSPYPTLPQLEASNIPAIADLVLLICSDS